MSDLPNLLRVIADNRGYAPGFSDVWEAIREAADIIERQQQEIEDLRGTHAATLEAWKSQQQEIERLGRIGKIEAEMALADDNLIERQQQEIEMLRSLLPSKWYGDGQ